MLFRSEFVGVGTLRPADHAPHCGVPFVAAVPYQRGLRLALQRLDVDVEAELALDADITVASEDATFEQIEIDRGIFPFGGGTARWVQTVGWGNAMQYLLTGDALDAREAHRLGLVQRVVSRDELLAMQRTLEDVHVDASIEAYVVDLVRATREAREAKKSSTTVSAAAALTSASFEGNKKKFGWPANGFISQRFGRQKHPVLPRVETWNDGINIQTGEGEKVRTIFKGEVRRVAFIPAIGTSVIISHGEYFSVYAGLKDVFVKSGDKVETNQDIGVVLMNGEIGRAHV